MRTIIASLLLVALSGCGSGSTAPISRTDDVSAADLSVRSVEDIKEHVITPATVELAESEALHEGHGYWSVSGEFDAQNGFGALRRWTFLARYYYPTTADEPELFTLALGDEVVFFDKDRLYAYGDAFGLDVIQDYRDAEELDAENDRLMDLIGGE